MTNYQKCVVAEFGNSAPMARAVLVARGGDGLARPDPRIYHVIGQPVAPPAAIDAPSSSRSGNVGVRWAPSPTAGVDRYVLELSTDGDTWRPEYDGAGLDTTVRIVEEMTIELRVRACIRSMNACSAPTHPVTVKVVPTFPNYLTEDSCEPIPIVVPAQENVGAIAGEAGVSGGAASYQIPIVIAPGRRGMQPNLALVYNSRGGNDLAGVGFGLSGFSRIHRCPRTPVHDGEAKNVDFSPLDKLCLDGTRLVLVSGTYGAAGSEYRTELDQFARIKMLGSINDPNTTFEVERKSGIVDVYGGPTARESYDSRTLNWWIQESRDRQNNSVRYEFTRIAGHFVPSEIVYTESGGSTGDRRVSIDYESRPDRA